MRFLFILRVGVQVGLYSGSINGWTLQFWVKFLSRYWNRASSSKSSIDSIQHICAWFETAGMVLHNATNQVPSICRFVKFAGVFVSLIEFFPLHSMRIELFFIFRVERWSLTNSRHEYINFCAHLLACLGRRFHIEIVWRSKTVRRPKF